MTRAPRARGVLRWCAALALLGAVAFAALFTAVLVAAQGDDRTPADAIVVLGAAQYNGRPSPVLRARLDHALTLLRGAVAPRIVVTGGQAEGDRESEAAVGARYLVEHGAPASAVATAPEGRDTRRSMDAVRLLMARERLVRVVLVSDPFHMLRLRLEARRLGLVATTSPTPDSPIADRPLVELQYLLAEAVKVPVAWIRSW